MIFVIISHNFPEQIFKILEFLLATMGSVIYLLTYLINRVLNSHYLVSWLNILTFFTISFVRAIAPED